MAHKCLITWDNDRPGQFVTIDRRKTPVSDSAPERQRLPEVLAPLERVHDRALFDCDLEFPDARHPEFHRFFILSGA